MNYKSKLNQIRVVLGLQVKMASAKLKDGKTIVEAEEFAPGSELFVIGEDGSKAPAPAGEHILEDGTVVEVDESGKISEISSAAEESDEEEIEAEVEKEPKPVKMADGESPIDGSEPNAPKKEDAVDEKIATAMTKVMAALEPLVKDVAEMKARVAKMEEQYSKFAKAPAAGKIPTLNENAKAEMNQVDVFERFKELKNSMK